jgi:hypothetical protein
MQLGQQQRMQPHPHARLLPLDHPPIAGRAGAEAELERQMPPRDPRVEHEQNPLQRGAIIEPLSTRVTETALDPRQLRRDARPEPIRHDPRPNSHRHPSQLDDRCRRRSSSGKGSLHFDSISKKVF